MTKFGLVSIIQTIIALITDQTALDLSYMAKLAIAGALPTNSDAVIYGNCDGWAYYGARSDGGWTKRYFAIQGDQSEIVPRPSDRIVALGNVNLREGVIEFDEQTQQWVNKPHIAVIRAGDTAKVRNVIEVSEGFFWVGVGLD